MSTYLKGIIPKYLVLLEKAKNNAESDKNNAESYVTAILQHFEDVLRKLEDMDMLTRVDILLKSKADQKTDQADHDVVIHLQTVEKEKTEPQPSKDLDMLKRPKFLGQTLLYQVACLERRLDSSSISLEAITNSLDLMKPIVEKINRYVALVQKLPMTMPEQDLGVAQQMSRQKSTLQPGLEDGCDCEESLLIEDGLTDRFEKSHFMSSIRRSYADLEGTDLKVCLLSLSIFPDYSFIKKRPLIYWWIGEGFITATHEKKAEEIGEEIFAKLMKRDLIQPDKDESSCELLVKSVTMHPWIRRMLISLAREAKLFHFKSRWPMMPSVGSMNCSLKRSCRRLCLVTDDPIPQDVGLAVLLTVFNVDLQYLNLKREWLEKLEKVEVLQLGRWQKSGTYHIEMEYQRSLGSQAVGFQKGLGAQKYLKYLSLRGISRITELPASILNLISLEILDLRACHDLERLPSDISSLKKLTHLDVSECYLLEGMPKGIPKLASLQVLKGFLIGTLKKTPCRLGDLAKLQSLRRLSIHMGNEAVVQTEEFSKLQGASSLRHLKISWGVISSNFKKDIDIESKKLLFPPNLEKLDLQGYPLKDAPDGLQPSKLKKLKKLYIMGGELNSLEHKESNEHWKVEILRLNFLKNLTIDPESFKKVAKEMFPRLQYWTMNPLSTGEK